jgi:transposase
MPSLEAPSVQTQPVGYAPILRHYFERCRLVDIIDQQVALDPRRPELSHGEACIAMITGILHHVFQLYNMRKFATDTDILQILLPEIAAEAYFDDRLGDTLDALYDHGLGNLELLLTRHMLTEFEIETTVCHDDTTTASVYGNCDNHRTDTSITLSFGYSKKHRADLKQFVWSLSVSADSAFPLFQQAYSGNTADVETYLEQWQHLIDLLGRQDFLYVADSKLLSKENMAYIHDHAGFFLAPAPMYASYRAVFEAALAAHRREHLLPHKDRFNRGFEVPLPVSHKGKEYVFRMLILYDHKLFARKRQNLTQRIDHTRAAFTELATKLNRYRLKTPDAIDKACQSILQKHQTTDFFRYTISNEPIITYKQAKRGRPAKGQKPEQVSIVRDHFRVELVTNDTAIDIALLQCGYYPLITNKSEAELSLADAMLTQKDQYKPEHTHRRSKSGYHLEPIYLHIPERIEAFLFLFKIVLQLLVLIERTARSNIERRDKGLDNFRPNRHDVRNPTAEYLLKEFQYIVKVSITLPDNSHHIVISDLTEVQQDILNLLDVPLDCFTARYLFHSG